MPDRFSGVVLALAGVVVLLWWLVIAVPGSLVSGAALRAEMAQVGNVEGCVEEGGVPHLSSQRFEVEAICLRAAAGEALGRAPLDPARVHASGTGVVITVVLCLAVAVAGWRAGRHWVRTPQPGPWWRPAALSALRGGGVLLVGLGVWWAGLLLVAAVRDLPYDPLSALDVTATVLRTVVLGAACGLSAFAFRSAVRPAWIAVPVGLGVVVGSLALLIAGWWRPAYEGDAAWFSPTENVYALLGFDASYGTPVPDGECPFDSCAARPADLGPMRALGLLVAGTVVGTLTVGAVAGVRRRARRPSPAYSWQA